MQLFLYVSFICSYLSYLICKIIFELTPFRILRYTDISHENKDRFTIKNIFSKKLYASNDSK